MEKSFGLYFYLKKSKWMTEGDEVSIYLRITVNGKSTEFSTKRKCDPLQWNVAARRVIGKTDFARSINLYLDELQRKIYNNKRLLSEGDQPVTESCGA